MLLISYNTYILEAGADESRKLLPSPPHKTDMTDNPHTIELDYISHSSADILQDKKKTLFSRFGLSFYLVPTPICDLIPFQNLVDSVN